MTSNTVDKYRYEDNPYITYEEAGDVLTIATQSVVGFATENKITRGQVMIRGRKRGVLNTKQFYDVVRAKNYFGDQTQEVVWSK